MAEISIYYNNLLKEFNKLYENKIIKITNDEINDILLNFCNKLQEEKSMFKYLLSRDNRLFKGLKCTLIPKIKMEVILYYDDNTPDDKKIIINNIWNQIMLLYILTESNKKDSDMGYVYKIFNCLDDENKELINIELQEKIKSSNVQEPTNNPLLSTMLEKLGSSVDISQLKNLISSENIPTELQNIVEDLNMDKIKELLNSPESKNGNEFVENILNDIKNKFQSNEQVDSKKFVENLFDVGNNLSDTYGPKIKNGDISIQDIISGVSNVINDSNNDIIGNITESIDINKLNFSEIFEEVKHQMDGKLPKEIINLMNNLNGENLKNFNLDGFLNLVVTDNKVNKNLTPEQKEELIKFYDNLEI